LLNGADKAASTTAHQHYRKYSEGWRDVHRALVKRQKPMTGPPKVEIW
jgi:hypothetical protein